MQYATHYEEGKKVSFKKFDLNLAGLLFLPDGFDADAKYPAVVVTHPGGGVKEQCSSLYAWHLARAGYVALAFDASHQGESEGLPRCLEDPFSRVEDIRSAVDYLVTLPYVDEERIGAMGVCAGGGLLSMAQVAGIVLLTSAYAGLLEATGLLDGLSSLCKRLSLRLGAFRTTVLAGLPVAAVSCNQTLGIMLTKQLCAPLWQNGKEMVLPLENGIVLLAAIIPWSIAGSVPCAIMGVGPECLPYAFYLYMVPLTDMLLRRR